MLVSLNWLKELVEIKEDPTTFGDILTMSGTKVETITPVSDVVSGIYTGLITKIEKHPDADKLQVCTLNMGKTLGKRTIITSATNVFKGAVVPVALEGAVIGNGTKMDATEFRGIKSYGMMCSVEEMGLDTNLFSKEIVDGIYIMPLGVEPGCDIRQLMWVDDQIIDLEITANRADCQSVYGIAKEAAAALNKSVKQLDLYDANDEGNSQIEDFLSVKIESDLCSRYVAKMFKVNKIEPSPLWMQLKLLNCGVRPINNIVDVTNYVMLELGQPLHAFDYKSLSSDTIVIKTNTGANSVITLDDKEREIEPEMLMITNGEKPVAIAGVMGGANSEITDSTEYVVLESACFDKSSIRITSKKLGLRTEASGKYEKGLFPNLAYLASLRATQLFIQIGACEVIPGIQDVYPTPTQPTSIDVDCNWINRFLGTDLTLDTISSILKRLFLDVTSVDSHTLHIDIPDYRQDLKIREDIAEEVARIYGYDNLPSTIMGGTTLVGGKTNSQQYQDKLDEILVGSGYYQTLTTSFTNAKRYADTGVDLEKDIIALINPLGEDSAYMRNNLVGQQLELISLNYNRNNLNGRFFEIAQTYHSASSKGELPNEEKHLVISAYGDNYTYFDLKGIVELILNESGILDYEFTANKDPLYHPGRNAKIIINGNIVGYLGEIHPMVVKRMALPKRTYSCELNFDFLSKIAASVNIRFQELPKYPSSTRDIAMVLDESIPSAEIMNHIKAHDNGIINRVELFDVYQGKQIPEGKKSIAYSIEFRHMDRTLTDDDINPLMANIIDDLRHSFNAELRD